MALPSGVWASVAVHVAVTVAQIGVFVLAPEVYAQASPDFDKAPTFAFFRLIGLAEVGLTAVYLSALWYSDPVLLWMTVPGRLSTIPFSLAVVVLAGGPPSIVLGVVQDVSLGLWTLWAFCFGEQRDGVAGKPPRAKDRALLAEPVSRREAVIRFLLVVSGACDIAAGWGSAVYPVAVGSWFVDPELSMEPVHLGARSFGFMTGLIGCYQAFAAWRRAPLATYASFGVHQLVMGLCAGRLHELTGVAGLAGNIRPSPHALPAGSLLLASCLAAWARSPRSAARRKLD